MGKEQRGKETGPGLDLLFQVDDVTSESEIHQVHP